MIELRPLIVNKSIYLFLIWYFYRQLHSYRWAIVVIWDPLKSAYTIAGWLTLGTLIIAAGESMDIWSTLPIFDELWIIASILLIAGIPAYHLLPPKTDLDLVGRLEKTTTQPLSEDHPLIKRVVQISILGMVGLVFIVISVLVVLQLMGYWLAIQQTPDINPASLLRFTILTVALLFCWRLVLKGLTRIAPHMGIWTSNRSRHFRYVLLIVSFLFAYFVLYIWMPAVLGVG